MENSMNLTLKVWRQANGNSKGEFKTYQAKNVIVATGSSPQFWNMLKGIRHSIIEPVPSLFTLMTYGPPFWYLK